MLKLRNNMYAYQGLLPVISRVVTLIIGGYPCLRKGNSPFIGYGYTCPNRGNLTNPNLRKVNLL